MSIPLGALGVTFPDSFEDFDTLEWEEKFQKHLDFVATCRAEHGSVQDKVEASSRKVDEKKLKPHLDGCWLIKCDEVTSQYGSDDLRLHINCKGHNARDSFDIGEFDWDVVEGIMQFHTKMSRLPHRMSDAASDEDDEDEDDEGSPDDISRCTDDDVFELQQEVKNLTESLAATRALVVSGLRTLVEAKDLKAAKGAINSLVLAARNDTSTESSTKRKRHEDADLTGPGNKKARTTDEHPRRLYLLWRGRETGEGEIQLDRDDDKINLGHIDFTDDDCLEFHGVISGNLLGSEFPWSGYKIGNSAAPFRRSWEDYSEERYYVEEQERRA